MNLTNEKYNDVMEELKNNKMILQGNNLYFISPIEEFNLINNRLVKLELKNDTLYVLNKKNNTYSYDEDILNETIEKKRNKVRGYSTAIIGKIENSYSIYTRSHAVPAGDYNGFYWWYDNEREIKIPEYIMNYIDSLNSKFVKIA